MKKLIQIIMFLIIFGLGGLSGLISIELFQRGAANTPLGLILPQKNPEFGKPDKDIGYAFIPGASGIWTTENRARIKINDYGLRDDNSITTENPDDEYRVALLGDSVVEAFQVDHADTFDALSENQLENVTVINLAMSGSGPMRQLLRLEHYGLQFSPDMAFLMIDALDFSGPELITDTEFPAYKMNEKDEMVRSYSYRDRFSQRHMDTIYGKTYIWLLQNSQIIRALNEYRKTGFSHILGVPKLFATQTAPPTENQLACVNANLDSNYKFWVDHRPLLNWKATEQWMDDLEAISIDNNLDIFVSLYIPLAEKDCNDLEIKREAILQAINKEFKKHRIELIDWNKELSNVMGLDGWDTQDIHNLRGFGINLGNGHLNYNGHKMFAETLSKIISERRSQ